MNLENYCIPHRHKLFGQTAKQPLNNFEPPKTWKYKQLWGVRPDPDLWGKIQYEKKIVKIYVG